MTIATAISPEARRALDKIRSHRAVQFGVIFEAVTDELVAAGLAKYDREWVVLA